MTIWLELRILPRRRCWNCFPSLSLQRFLTLEHLVASHSHSIAFGFTGPALLFRIIWGLPPNNLHASWWLHFPMGRIWENPLCKGLRWHMKPCVQLQDRPCQWACSSPIFVFIPGPLHLDYGCCRTPIPASATLQWKPLDPELSNFSGIVTKPLFDLQRFLACGAVCSPTLTNAQKTEFKCIVGSSSVSARVNLVIRSNETIRTGFHGCPTTGSSVNLRLQNLYWAYAFF